MQVYWNRKYKCHHHYDPVTKLHWRCDIISNKEHDRHPSAGDIRERRAMKRAARQEACQIIRDELCGYERVTHPPHRRSREERQELSRRRSMARGEARGDYPFPHSRPFGRADYRMGRWFAEMNKKHEVYRLERELAAVKNRLESHPWDVMKLPGLKAKLDQARRQAPARLF